MVTWLCIHSYAQALVFVRVCKHMCLCVYIHIEQFVLDSCAYIYHTSRIHTNLHAYQVHEHVHTCIHAEKAYNIYICTTFNKHRHKSL